VTVVFPFFWFVVFGGLATVGGFSGFFGAGFCLRFLFFSVRSTVTWSTTAAFSEISSSLRAAGSDGVSLCGPPGVCSCSFLTSLLAICFSESNGEERHITGDVTV
jgi:hypothetical protein